jgi:hypothetical protein
MMRLNAKTTMNIHSGNNWLDLPDFRRLQNHRQTRVQPQAGLQILSMGSGNRNLVKDAAPSNAAIDRHSRTSFC